VARSVSLRNARARRPAIDPSRSISRERQQPAISDVGRVSARSAAARRAGAVGTSKAGGGSNRTCSCSGDSERGLPAQSACDLSTPHGRRVSLGALQDRHSASDHPTCILDDTGRPLEGARGCFYPCFLSERRGSVRGGRNSKNPTAHDEDTWRSGVKTSSLVILVSRFAGALKC